MTRSAESGFESLSILRFTMPNTSGGTTPQAAFVGKAPSDRSGAHDAGAAGSQYFFKPAPGPKPVKPTNDNAAAKLR